MEDILLYEEVVEESDPHLVQQPESISPTVDQAAVLTDETEAVILEEEEKEEATEKVNDLELEEKLNQIIERIERDDLGNDTEKYNMDSADSDDNIYVDYRSVESVNESIIDTPLIEYSIEQSYLFLIFILLFMFIVVKIIRKGIPRWK